MKLGLSPYVIGRTISIVKLRKILGDIGFTIEEETTIFHDIHPDILMKWLETFIRWVGQGSLDKMFMKLLITLDHLEKRRTKFLTGRYIALKAIKN
jgi:hypothetical protein